MYVKNFVDTTVWFAEQFNETDFIKTVGDLVVDAEVIVSKVQGVVPESLRNMAAFAKEFKWVKNLFNLADRIKDLKKTEEGDFDKIAGLVSLTAAHIFGFIQSLHELRLVELGGYSPYTKLAQEICYIPASIYTFKGLNAKRVEEQQKQNNAYIDTINEEREAFGEVESNLNQAQAQVARYQAQITALQNTPSLSDEQVAKLKKVKRLLKFWFSVERNQEHLENLTVKGVPYFTRGEAGYQVNREAVEGAFTAERDWKKSLSGWKCILSQVENVGKIALGVFGLLASFFGFKSIAIISSGMLLSWTFIHLVSFCRKLVGNAMKVDNTAAYRFPPTFDQGFDRVPQAA
jgi:hypothetical protein